ncbi:MAG: DUF368 domain-containing protein [Phycisphaerales bacterium]|nr:MAG: DUF368 domain-containing protein [Phycisphaerales bacterium]
MTEPHAPPSPPPNGQNPSPDAGSDAPDPGRLTPGLIARCAVGGAFMGLANLVPGISGGTMLVAVGIYRRFIEAISDLTRLRLRPTTIAVLAIIVCSALVAIGAGSGIIAASLVSFRWGMFSLFIGLTLGGAPILARMTRPFNPGAWIGLACGALVMLGLVVLQTAGAERGDAGSTSTLMLALGGVAGASAMILPGVSGAYLLLLLGQYEPIVNSIKDAVDAARAADVGAALAQLRILVPVGVGVLVGVVGVANILRYVLRHYEKPTLGLLLGLLLAAPAGLYPFREGVPPTVGEVFKGEPVTEANAAEFAEPSNAKDWEERLFTPTIGQVAGSLGLVGLGFIVTMGVARLGREKDTN